MALGGRDRGYIGFVFMSYVIINITSWTVTIINKVSRINPAEINYDGS